MDSESIVDMRNEVATAGIKTVDLRCWFALEKTVQERTVIGTRWGGLGGEKDCAEV